MDVYEIVTSKIIEKLEKGVIPWREPWTAGLAPQNFVTKKAYKGVNPYLLQNPKFDACPFWLTFNQAKNLGGKVKVGEKASIVIYWLIKDAEKDEKGNITKDRVFIPLYYNVFNLLQTEGIKIPDLTAKSKLSTIEKGEAIIKGFKDCPQIVNASGKACYYPTLDKVSVPVLSEFKTAEGYYNTLFHELGHSTGHEKRLNRQESTKARHFGSEEYSKEELVAEMTAGFLQAHAEIESEKQTEQNAAYIASWLKVFKGDKRFLISASSMAQKATEYILTGKKAGQPQKESEK